MRARRASAAPRPGRVPPCGGDGVATGTGRPPRRRCVRPARRLPTGPGPNGAGAPRPGGRRPARAGGREQPCAALKLDSASWRGARARRTGLRRRRGLAAPTGPRPGPGGCARPLPPTTTTAATAQTATIAPTTTATFHRLEQPSIARSGGASAHRPVRTRSGGSRRSGPRARRSSPGGSVLPVPPQTTGTSAGDRRRILTVGCVAVLRRDVTRKVDRVHRRCEFVAVVVPWRAGL